MRLSGGAWTAAAHGRLRGKAPVLRAASTAAAGPPRRRGAEQGSCYGYCAPSPLLLPCRWVNSNRKLSKADTSTSSGSSADTNSNHQGISAPPTSQQQQPQQQKLHFALRLLGPKLAPYGRLARVDKPIGTLLLLWPCWWSTALAAPAGHLPDLKLLALFGTGAFVMRSAGCIINDLWDKDFDKSVERCKDRPLASGELSTNDALLLLGGSLTAGLGVLLSLNMECWKLGFASMPIVVTYPLMKRFTWWPQAVLGLAMNWGALVGWTAVHGSTDWSVVLPLYSCGVCWTMVYDTLYGHQDKADDARLGLKSTSLLFGDRTKPVLSGFATASIASLLYTGVAMDMGAPFYLGTAAAAAHLARQLYLADLNNPSQLFELFRSNQYFGALVMAAITAGNFFYV